jgi:hypothetical protein
MTGPAGRARRRVLTRPGPRLFRTAWVIFLRCAALVRLVKICARRHSPLRLDHTIQASCPRLSRASTSFLPRPSKQGVDGRDTRAFTPAFDGLYPAMTPERWFNGRRLRWPVQAA